MLLLQCYAMTDKKVIHNVDEFFFSKERIVIHDVLEHTAFRDIFYKTIKKYLMVDRI